MLQGGGDFTWEVVVNDRADDWIPTDLYGKPDVRRLDVNLANGNVNASFSTPVESVVGGSMGYTFGYNLKCIGEAMGYTVGLVFAPFKDATIGGAIYNGLTTGIWVVTP